MSQPDSPSSLTLGVMWATRITSVGLEFAIPALVGMEIDRRWSTGRVATFVGAGLGFLTGMVHLVRIAREANGRKAPPKRR